RSARPSPYTTLFRSRRALGTDGRTRPASLVRQPGQAAFHFANAVGVFIDPRPIGGGDIAGHIAELLVHMIQHARLRPVASALERSEEHTSELQPPDH